MNNNIEQLQEELEILASRVLDLDEGFDEEAIDELEAQLCCLDANQFKDINTITEHMFRNDELIMVDSDEIADGNVLVNLELMEFRAKLLKNEVKYPTRRQREIFERLVAKYSKITKDLEAFENDIHTIEKNIEEKYEQNIEAHKDGINTRDLAMLLVDEYPDKYLKHMGHELKRLIDEMAIGAMINYKEELRKFEVGFAENNKKIKISLLDVLEYKTTYNKSFVESMEALLMYKLIYGEDEEAIEKDRKEEADLVYEQHKEEFDRLEAESKAGAADFSLLNASEKFPKGLLNEAGEKLFKQLRENNDFDIVKNLNLNISPLPEIVPIKR